VKKFEITYIVNGIENTITIVAETQSEALRILRESTPAAILESITVKPNIILG